MRSRGDPRPLCRAAGLARTAAASPAAFRGATARSAAPTLTTAMDVPGQDGFLLAGGAGDGAGPGVVLAGLRGGVPVRVVAGFCEQTASLRSGQYRFVQQGDQILGDSLRTCSTAPPMNPCSSTRSTASAASGWPARVLASQSATPCA